jgi:hypothetical protein
MMTSGGADAVLRSFGILCHPLLWLRKMSFLHLLTLVAVDPDKRGT